MWFNALMPSKNRIKLYASDTYYHVYNRGVEKRIIFGEAEDYKVFMNLLKRYLDRRVQKDSKGREYDNLHDSLDLLCFCLMPNHFHLLLYTYDEKALTRLMRGVCTAYTYYFNRKYKRIGPLFQDRYKASIITNEAYLQHISRYIHLNPKGWLAWPYSSLPYYRGSHEASWVKSSKILSIFESRERYLQFLSDYQETKASLDLIKHQLAD